MKKTIRNRRRLSRNKICIQHNEVEPESES